MKSNLICVLDKKLYFYVQNKVLYINKSFPHTCASSKYKGNFVGKTYKVYFTI